jgi:hypothetical protein
LGRSFGINGKQRQVSSCVSMLDRQNRTRSHLESQRC